MSILLDDARSVAEEAKLSEALAGKTVLVTGAAGFLGSNLVEALLAANADLADARRIVVIAVARDASSAKKRFAHHSSNPHLRLLVQDVCDPVPEDVSADYFIHAASPASPRAFGFDPVGTILANTLGTRNVLDAASRGSGTVLFVSTSEVYGQLDPVEIPTSESSFGHLDPVDPRSVYAEAKRAGEALCVAWTLHRPVATKIVRPFHVYGPGMSLGDGRVFSDFVQDVVAGRSLKVRSDGRARRSFCYSADAVRAFFCILLEGRTAFPYNVGNPDGELSVTELAELLVELRPEKTLRIEHQERPAGDTYVASSVSRSAPQIDRLLGLGWKPRYSQREGFDRTLRSFEEFGDG